MLACAACDGLWWPAGALGRWLETQDDLAYPNPESVPPAAITASTCPDDPGVCLVRVPYAPMARVAVLRCPYCVGLWLPRGSLPTLRALAETVALRSVAPAPEAGSALVDPDAPTMPPLSLRHCALSLPVAVLWALVWRLLPFGRLLPGGVRIPLHELGHTLAAWATGHFAVPIPLGLTLSSEGRSAVVVLGCPLVGIGLAAWAARRRRWPAVGLCLGLILGQLGLTFGLTLHQHQELLLWWGCGGELALSALLAASFYAALSPRWRWDLARWMAFPVGVYVLVDQTLSWWATRSDPDRIPWGGAFSTDGDMDQLHGAFGWSEAALTRGYLRLAGASFALVVLVWFVATAQAWRRSRGATLGTVP